MNITARSETLNIHSHVEGGPNTQLYSAGGFHTYPAVQISLTIVNGEFQHVDLTGPQYTNTARRYTAADTFMPNWLREFVLAQLSSVPLARWPMAGEQADEYFIYRDATDKLPELRLAIVDAGEVRQFFKAVSRDVDPSEFVIAHDGDETTDGRTWLKRNKVAA